MPDRLRDCDHTHFGTVVVATELPWQGQLPAKIKRLGVRVFRAVIQVAAGREK